jgi:flavodoxin I
MKSIGIIFWPKKGSVELNARRILTEFGEENAELIPLKDIDPDQLKVYPYLIAGCSTVGADSWRDAYAGNPWTKFFSRLQETATDLEGKRIALFGLGDQILYPEHYVDELIRLKKEFTALGAVIVGKWPMIGYEHTDSKSIEEDHFVGLALDEHNQPELSVSRIKQWSEDLKKNHFNG